MGRLKEHCLAISEEHTEEVLGHYRRFLEFSWHNRKMPSGYENALTHIADRTQLKKFEIDFIIREQVESIYEGY
jgi:hypothetical protein